jgi:hypothetical protein
MPAKLETGTQNAVLSQQEGFCSSWPTQLKRWPRRPSAGRSAQLEPVGTSSLGGILTPWSIATRTEFSRSLPWLTTSGILSTGWTARAAPSNKAATADVTRRFASGAAAIH